LWLTVRSREEDGQAARLRDRVRSASATAKLLELC
jgi:hypothetical protein